MLADSLAFDWISVSSEMLFNNHIVLFKVAIDVPEGQTFGSQGPFMITYTQADEAKIVIFWTPPPLNYLYPTSRWHYAYIL